MSIFRANVFYAHKKSARSVRSVVNYVMNSSQNIYVVILVFLMGYGLYSNEGEGVGSVYIIVWSNCFALCRAGIRVGSDQNLGNHR